MRQRFSCVLFALSALVSAGCNSGGGALAPLELAYPATTSLQALQSTAIAPATTPSRSVTYTISPALPAGLELEPTTGVIAGTPQGERAARDYVVTATAANGDTVNAAISLTSHVSLLPQTDDKVEVTAASGNTLFVGGRFHVIGRNTGSLAIMDQSDSDRRIEPYVDSQFGVYAAVADPLNPGAFYVGGDFEKIGGVSTAGLAHVLADGSVDTTFDVGVIGQVRALLLDGTTLYLGGGFDHLMGQASGGLAAIDLTTGTPGSLALVVAGGLVNTLAKLGDSLFVGGDFNTVDGQSRGGFAVVDLTNNTLSSITANANSHVMTIATVGARLFVAGIFTSIGGSSRTGLAELDPATGAVQPFDMGLNGSARAMAVEGTTIYVGGDFTNVASTSRSRFAAIDATGAALTSFAPSFDDMVLSISVDAGSLFVGGDFTAVDAATRYRYAEFDLGTEALGDAAHCANLPRVVVTSGSNRLVGGFMGTFGGAARSYLAAVDLTTGEPTTFDAHVDGEVWALAADATTLYAAGDFFAVGVDSVSALAGIDRSTGAATWIPTPDDYTYALLLDGTTLYVGGDFGTVDSNSRTGLFAFDTGTQTITSFDAGADAGVSALAMDSGLLYVGGSFGNIGGAVRSNLAAIDPGTGLANSLDCSLDNEPLSMVVAGNTIYLAGWFSTVGGTTRNSMAAIDKTTGAVLTLDPNLDNRARAVAVVGTTAFVGGDFTQVGATNRAGFATVFGDGSLGTYEFVDSNVFSLQIVGNDLVVGGFGALGPASGIAPSNLLMIPLGTATAP